MSVQRRWVMVQPERVELRRAERRPTPWRPEPGGASRRVVGFWEAPERVVEREGVTV